MSELENLDYDALADRVVERMDPGVYAGGKRFVLDRRSLIKIGTGGLSAGMLAALGARRAAAQEADGTLGSEDERLNWFAADIDAWDVNAESVSTGEGTIGNVTLTQDTVESVEVETGFRVEIESGDFETIFDVSDPVDVLGGTVQGESPDRLRFTWEDGSTDTISNPNPARDGSGDVFGVIFVPAVRQITKLEIRSGGTGDYGWDVIRL